MQQWLPFDYILKNGIIKLKDNTYIKIIKVNPINFNLKSDFEKLAILNSYKIFLKTCNFDLQLLIQSNKEDLTTHISNVKENSKEENNFNLNNISNQYIEYIEKLNKNKKSSSKNFYIIIRNSNEELNLEYNKDIEKIASQDLNDKYFKIKECLSRIGNNVKNLENKEEIKEVLFSFFNSRIFLK